MTEFIGRVQSRRLARQRPSVSPMRSFDPRTVGALECRAWVTYYRHEWFAFLLAAVRLVRETFALPWPATILGAWWVLRANQAWAPYPDNRPDLAQRIMRRFYALVARVHHETFDVDRAAALEIAWWRAHREAQREAAPADAEADERLVQALQALYAHVYDAGDASMRQAAQERADAMRVSDVWVREGCDVASARISEERAALVRSYAALLAVVHRV